jgi:hypothetical protein
MKNHLPAPIERSKNKSTSVMKCSRIDPSRSKDPTRKIILKTAKTQSLQKKKKATSNITKNKSPLLRNQRNESFPVLQVEAATLTASVKLATKARAKAEAEVESASTEEEAKAEKTMEEDIPTTTKGTEIVKKNQERIDTEGMSVMTEKIEERTSNQKKIEGSKRKKISITAKSQKRDTKTIVGKKIDMIAMTNEETQRRTEEK